MLTLISDIHLERYPARFLSFMETIPLHLRFHPHPPGSALFIAGDLGYPHRPLFQQFLRESAAVWDHVFYVPGNHEYDHAEDMQEVDEHIAHICSSRTNIHLLRMGVTYKWQGYTVAGSTLWSHIDNPTHPRHVERNARHHAEHAALNCVLGSSDTPVLVMSHYPPTCTALPKRYAKRSGIANPFDYLVCPPVSLWLCGHLHIRDTLQVNDTRIVFNAWKDPPLLSSVHFICPPSNT